MPLPAEEEIRSIGFEVQRRLASAQAFTGIDNLVAEILNLPRDVGMELEPAMG